MILPEVYLPKKGTSDEAKAAAQEGVRSRVVEVNSTMRRYMREGLLEPHDGIIYLERMAGKHLRRGIVMCVDLEDYCYDKGSTSLIRATEKTVPDRLPPRVEIRKDALLELPHIMVLVDDPEDRIVSSLTESKAEMKKLYDFDLMEGGGHIEGYAVTEALQAATFDRISALFDREAYNAKYGVKTAEGDGQLIYAMGDGNHSLATAKVIWENLKKDKGFEAVQDDRRRYALVEINNVHDDGIVFEPIHRVLFDCKKDVLACFREALNASVEEVASVEEMHAGVETPQEKGQHVFGYLANGKFYLVRCAHDAVNVYGVVQPLLEKWDKRTGEETVFAGEVDYIHGTEATVRDGMETGNCGIFLPTLPKSTFFESVIKMGVLPCKSFSMGEAEEKRYYLECRRILEQ